VRDEQEVKKDQPIAYIGNTGSYTDVLKLQQWISRAIAAMQEDSSFSLILTDPLPGLMNLGELQPAYQQFFTIREQNRRFANADYYNKKRSILNKDMQLIVAQKGNSQRQKNMSEEDRAMIEKEFNAYKKLADDKVIAPLELHQYKSKLLAREQTLEQLQTQVIGSDISLAAKQQEILELEKMMKEQKQQLQSALLELKSQVELWIRQYVITAPEDGKLFFVKGLNENNNVSAGQLLFYLEPMQTGFYAELQGAQHGFGKVKEGQRVIIKVESHPSHEFGYITGAVGRTTGMPDQGDSVTVRLLLPNGLTTNYGDTIPYRKNLQASAEIITDDKRLISRLFSQLR
jgi:hypothetical protein